MPKPPHLPRQRPGLPPRVGIAELLQSGLRAHQAGRAGEAAEAYRQVLAREPGQPAANHLLGVLALQSGRPDEAIGLIERAILANPSDPQYHLNLGVAFNAVGRTPDAISTLQRAVALKPDLAGAYSNLGMALRAAGRLDEAVAAYDRAVALAPREPGFRFNQANALAQAGANEAALSAYREALRLRPGFPAALSGLVQLSEQIGRNQDALAAVDNALASSPGAGELHLLRGRVLYRLRDLVGAEAAYMEAVRCAPHLGEARFHLAHMVRWSLDRPDVGEVARLVSGGAASVDDQIYGGFALGRMLADLGRHDESVRAYREANRLHWQRSGAVQRDYAAELSACTIPFERATPDLKSGGVRGARPIFIIGLPRSGKSTLEAILSRHPQVRATGEQPVLQRLIGAIGENSHLDADTATRLGRAYLDEVATLVGSGQRTVDTMPPNFRFVGHVRAALPDAVVIHACRDQRGQRIALLEKYLPQPGYEYASDLTALRAYESAYLDLMQRWHSLVGGFVTEFDLGADPDSESRARRLLSLCGLDWRPECAAPVESEPVLGDWSASRRAANAAAQREAWHLAHPEFI